MEHSVKTRSSENTNSSNHTQTNNSNSSEVASSSSNEILAVSSQSENKYTPTSPIISQQMIVHTQNSYKSIEDVIKDFKHAKDRRDSYPNLYLKGKYYDVEEEVHSHVTYDFSLIFNLVNFKTNHFSIKQVSEGEIFIKEIPIPSNFYINFLHRVDKPFI